MSRKSAVVIGELLDRKRQLVTNFPDLVKDTGDSLDNLIPGTAVFPGGTGLWRGTGFFGPLPDLFPDAPIMFVGHNFDSISGHNKSLSRGGELQTPATFWNILLGYLQWAGIAPADCFFTNALMGLMPGKATGNMPSAPEFEAQCLAFLLEQIRIVKPQGIIALGGEARQRVQRACPSTAWTHVMHPSARQFKPNKTRAERIQAQGSIIEEFLQKARGSLFSRR